MKPENLILTLFAEDAPGVLQKTSDTILEQGGSWMESSLSRLCGKFAGIVHVQVSPEKKGKLLEALASLAEQGIEVTVQAKTALAAEAPKGEYVELVVEANDRPGIVEEIASALAAADVNIEQMETACESASMAGYSLFSADLFVVLPQGLSIDQLEEVLEQVSDDLMVSIIETE